jgi:membrane fusion protein (multidrug efflux system)
LGALILAIGTVAALLNGCGGEPGEAQNRGAGPGGPQEPPTTVAVEPVGRGTVVARYTTTATLEAENRAEILARTQGVVTDLVCEEGDRVAADAELLRLEEDAARLRLQQAEVALAEQRSVFERHEASLKQEVVSQAEYDLAKANLEKAKVDRDIAAHELSYTRVRAPFAAVVTRRLVELGQTVNVGTPLFEIASFDPLLARVHVPAKEMGTLRTGQAVDLVLDSNQQKMTGRVQLVSPIIDAASGTVKVTVHVNDYPEGTRPGDFAHVSVVTQLHENVLRVPNIAVFEDRNEQVVFVAQDSVAVRRPVEVGFIDDTYTEVREGLEEGEQVVVKGQRSLRDGGRIRILDATGEAVSENHNETPERRGS